MLRHTLFALLLIAALVTLTHAGGGPECFTPSFTSADPATAHQAAVSLRGMGAYGLDVAMQIYDKHPSPQLADEIDFVAGQRDAITSRLYWYTDLDAAQAEAKKQKKPILSLRLLGKLTDEYSCANSRFFRTVLYANKNVSQFLRENFILHWSSERPVPVITIDFGDGRVMKRTITGNSIHYILANNGRVVDALPGLYDPSLFLSELRSAYNAAVTGNQNSSLSYSTTPKLRLTPVENYAQRKEDLLLREWEQYVKGVGLTIAPLPVAQKPGENPAAPLAGRVAIGKGLVEMPMLRQVSPQFAAAIDRDIDTAEAQKWDRIAALARTGVKLDAASIALIRKQNAAAYDKSPELLTKTIDNFEKAIALDTVKNQYLLRRTILHWLAESEKPVYMAALNTRVYAELFLTPRSDPWLGLQPDATYTALTNDTCPASQTVSR